MVVKTNFFICNTKARAKFDHIGMFLISSNNEYNVTYFLKKQRNNCLK